MAIPTNQLGVRGPGTPLFARFSKNRQKPKNGQNFLDTSLQTVVAQQGLKNGFWTLRTKALVLAAFQKQRLKERQAIYQEIFKNLRSVP